MSDDEYGGGSTGEGGDGESAMGQGAEADAEGAGGSFLGQNCYRNQFSGIYQTERGVVARFNPDLHFIHEGACQYEGKVAGLDGVCEPGDEAYCGDAASSSSSSSSSDTSGSEAGQDGYGQTDMVSSESDYA